MKPYQVIQKPMADKYQNGDFVSLDTVKPIAFNPWKHHKNYVCEQIQLIKKQGDKSISTVLASIGGTLLDFYMGDLDIESIATEIVQILGNQNAVEYDGYVQWLGLPGNTHKSLLVSDGSRWVLRLGHNPDFFIHIHPWRYSPLTCRCRPTTLVTAIAYRYLFGFDDEGVDLERLNKARAFANLSPIASLKDVSALVGFIKILKANQR